MNSSTNETADTEACIFDLSFRIPITVLFVATFFLSVSENILVTIVISIDKKTTTTFKWLPTEFGVDRHMYLNRIDTTGDGIYMVVPRVATWLKWNECFELCMVILNCRFFHHSADYHGRPLQSSDVCGSIKRYCVMAENICNRWISLDLRCNSRGINECFRLRANYGRNI